MTPTADRRSVAVFCMPLMGHFKRLRPVIAGLSRRGFAVNVYTHRQFASGVVRASGNFHDLFGQYPLEDADATSLPVPRRYVTHAAKFGDAISRDVATAPVTVIVAYDLLFYDKLQNLFSRTTRQCAISLPPTRPSSR